MSWEFSEILNYELIETIQNSLEAVFNLEFKIQNPKF